MLEAPIPGSTPKRPTPAQEQSEGESFMALMSAMGAPDG